MGKIRQKIMIDTDCASDDAMAIAMALNDPAYEIQLISAVSGNVPVQQAAVNALTTIEYAGTYNVPVYMGAENMLLRKLEYAYETHGNDGMGDIGLAPKSLKVSEGNGVVK
ncbi:nucleoside hydrolase, partial [Muricomes intestini]